MFNLEEFYKKCKSGEKVDCSGIFEYIKGFKNIILRGAAGQGKAVGKRLLEEGINVTLYWDQRYEELQSVNGIVVEKPFEKKFDSEDTIVIYCIPNHVIMPELMEELKKENYNNIIRGDILYSGSVCELSNDTKLSAQKCWASGECRSVICEKAQNIIKNQTSYDKSGDRIDLTYCCFIINSICNLTCKHCVQFINNYPLHARGNVPVETICRDIDIFLDMIDSVGTISVMGGETFMHPDIAKIAKKFSEKKNFGFVSFPTNGLYPIKPEQLEGITDPRIVIAFGYYLHVATEEQKEIYRKNVELVKSYGITYTESLHLPSWVAPTGMYKRNVDEQYMTNLKTGCTMPPRNLQVKNGKVHTCDKGVAVYNIGVADYPSDYVDLTKGVSLDEMRTEFRKFVDRPFYYTCGHCSVGLEKVESATQGKIDMINKI
ncbi:radical SAM protein [Clostridium beijerinckii]|uniref:radical SAM protein n=1 Tax=Clostridium beijerinckii TaxID=1520 RepID=UPI00047AE6C9|nr:radical SAM protein [Clostridium beijerinckii]